MHASTRNSSRRDFLRVALAAPLALPVVGATLASLLGCGGQEESAAPAGSAPMGKAPAPAPPAGGQAAAPAAPAAPAAGADEGKLVTEIPENAQLVAQLQYVGQSQKQGQNCANCLFYTAEGGGQGKCQLFARGLVAENGWCASWTQKPA